MENKNTIQTAQEIMGNLVVQNLNIFQQKLESYTAFDSSDIQMELYDGYGNVTIPLTKQHMIDDIMELLDEVINVNILYHYKRNNGQENKVVAYALPYYDEMYAVSLLSQQYGIIEEIHVTFFESLDIMFIRMRKELLNFEAMTKKRAYGIKVLQKRPMTQLYKDFL